MKAILILLLALALCTICTGDATAKHVIKAYFNGREATVTNVTLKVGEPFTVDLYITPDRNTTVAALLREPGGDWDAYSQVSGDPAGTVVHKMGGPNNTVHFQWIMEAKESWAGGTAPLNIQYDVWGENMGGDVQGYFTVVEAYISPEKYKPPPQAGQTAFPALAALALITCIRYARANA